MGFWDQLLLLFLVILLLVGLVLAYAGRLVFESLMSFLGALIGAMIGFNIGYSTLNLGIIGGLIICVVGALIGGLIFYHIVEFAIALFCGIIGGGIVVAVLGTGTTVIILAVVVGLIITLLAWHFIKEILSVATSLMGGMICGYAFIQIDSRLGWGLGGIWTLLAILIIVSGAIIQIKYVRERKTKRAGDSKDEKKSDSKSKGKNAEG